MPDSSKPNVGSSTRVWVGSTVMTCLGLILGAAVMIAGSLLRWRADAVLALYNRSGWQFDNIIRGDGKMTFAMGALIAACLLAGLLAQRRAPFMAGVAIAAVSGGLAAYEIIYIATRPGITGPGRGLYMVLAGSGAAFLCSLGGYLMMTERRKEAGVVQAAAPSREVA